MQTLNDQYKDWISSSVDEVGMEVLSQSIANKADYEPFACSRPNRYTKWLLSSALQKSIRRGRLDYVRRYCDGLLQIEPDYMFRRLNTVAAEDIGIANPLILAAYAKGGNSKTVRAKMGGAVAVARTLTAGLAASPKCRLGDELATLDLREMEEIAEKYHQAMAEQSDQELLDVLVDRKNPLTARAIALMYFTRFEPSGYNALVVRPAPTKRFRKQLLEVCEALGTPRLLGELAYVYSGRMMERQACFLPLAWDLMKDEPMKVLDDPELPTQELVINGFIAPAIDGHTSQGKKCLKQLIASDELAKSLVPLTLGGEDTLRAFHLTIFRTEGHLCANRLTSEESHRIRRLSSTAMVSHYCYEAAGGEQLLQQGPRLLDRLNVIRQQSAR